jgi:hypothetical protein
MFITAQVAELVLYYSDDPVPGAEHISLTPLMLVLALPLLGVAFGFAWTIYERRRDVRIQQVRIVSLEKKADEEPEKVRFVWDLATVKLEAYFNRNLNQVKAIFFIVVVVMAMGLGFILWGLHAALVAPDHVTVALIAAASGVITQFIGLTFMLIYKGTMLQATQFMSVLERINTVGMAVQILDSMHDDVGELKDETRVDIIRLLLSVPSAKLALTSRTKVSNAPAKAKGKGTDLNRGKSNA